LALTVLAATGWPLWANDIVLRFDAGQPRYVYESPACMIAWRWDKHKALLHNDMDCSIALVEMEKIHTRLLDRVMRNPSPSLRALYWGRLKQNRAHMLRFVLLMDKMWRSNQPALIDPVDLVQLLNKHHVFRELEQVFARQNMVLKVSQVKSLLFKRASRTPIYTELKKRGFRARQTVPYDAIIWFSIKPMDIETRPIVRPTPSVGQPPEK